MPNLQYSISDWHQLKSCRSNNSVDLSISVCDFVQDKKLSGTRISVNHTKYGTLFACVVNASGTMISPYEQNLIHSLSTEEILAELFKFGFIVSFDPKEDLSGSQISYLMSLNGLGYDKLRVLSVWHFENRVQVFRQNVVAFKIEPLPKWMNNNYSASDSEYTEAVKSGNAINVSAISAAQHFDWSWLNFVANISDIIADNS